MRNILSLILIIFICFTAHAQQAIDVRFSVLPDYNNGELDGMNYSLQTFYDINPRPGYLGIVVGLDLIYYRSKENNFSCDCDVMLHEGRPILTSAVTSYSERSYSTALSTGLFVRFKWNPIRKRKLRFFPTLDLMATNVLISNFYVERYWGLADGSSHHEPKTNWRDREIEFNPEFDIMPELKLDYLLSSDLGIRLGAVYRTCFSTLFGFSDDCEVQKGLYLLMSF